MPCLVLVSGIPAAGKTSFASSMKKSLLDMKQDMKCVFEASLGFCPVPVLVNFDEIENNLRKHNSESEPLVEPDLKRTGNNASLAYWHLARLAALEEVDRNLYGDSRNLIIVDDNLYYRSMRYKFCQLARKHRVGMITIVVECEISIAISRNQMRNLESRVNTEVIERMSRLFENPEPGSWEEHFIYVDGKAISDNKFPWSEILHAWLHPRLPQFVPAEMEAERSLQRKQTERNFIHQLDIGLRQVISSVAKSWKEEKKTISLTNFVLEANSARKRFLSVIRNRHPVLSSKTIIGLASRADILGFEHGQTKEIVDNTDSCAERAIFRASCPIATEGGSELESSSDGFDWREECEDGHAALRQLLVMQFEHVVEQLRKR